MAIKTVETPKNEQKEFVPIFEYPDGHEEAGHGRYVVIDGICHFVITATIRAGFERITGLPKL